jgi:hypothetical protein
MGLGPIPVGIVTTKSFRTVNQTAGVASDDGETGDKKWQEKGSA